MRETLLDRMYEEMLASGRVWPAHEISRVYLKMDSSPALAGKLIRTMLSGDSRFQEREGGGWEARSAPRATLSELNYLLAWVETGGARLPEDWVVWIRPREYPSDPPVRIEGRDPSAWEESLARHQGLRPATLQAGSFGRFEQWMCRRHASSEWRPAPVDLTAWARLALVLEGVPASETLSASRPAGLLRRWSLGPASEEDPAGLLRNVDEILDQLLDRHGAWTETELDERWERHLAARPVPEEGFDFPLESLRQLPESSGIYRFFDAAGSLLYVGKAANLARRVQSYFRPLPPEPSRRELLLKELRSFELEPMPSELEALVRETQAIRTQNPTWNVQVDVHPLEDLPPEWWWPLAFAAPGQDPENVSIFLLTGAESGFLFRLPRDPRSFHVESDAQAWVCWLEEIAGAGAAEPAAGPAEAEDGTRDARPEGPEVLEGPEARLALRYYLRRKEWLNRVEPAHVSDGEGLLASLLELAAQDPRECGPALPR